MDRRVGNTKKMGALFGILAAIGGPIPEPETIPYAFFILSNRLSSIFKSMLRASRRLQPPLFRNMLCRCMYILRCCKSDVQQAVHGLF